MTYRDIYNPWTRKRPKKTHTEKKETRKTIHLVKTRLTFDFHPFDEKRYFFWLFLVFPRNGTNQLSECQTAKLV